MKAGEIHFELASPTRILFGSGSLREAGRIAKTAGERALLVVGRRAQPAERLAAILGEHGVSAVTFSVTGEPEVETVKAGTALARREHCDHVVGIGGGSVLDAGKAIAAMLTNDGELLDYLEIIGQGRALARPSARFLAIPTTAGTGSEVTRNSVLSSPSHRLKVSLRSPFMVPWVALVDPELTCDLPPAITASTGLDALTQLVEPFVCARANPVTDALCREGIARAARSLRSVFADGRDAAARQDMALASLFGGIALANAGLGAVHGFAGPLGGMFGAPHGALCAALLPHVMEINLRALRQRQPGGDAVSRYDEIARLVTGDAGAVADDGVEWVGRLIADLRIPGLGAYGIRRENAAEIIVKAAAASSMKANPIALSPGELMEILERAV